MSTDSSNSQNKEQPAADAEAVCPVCQRVYPTGTQHCSVDQSELVVRRPTSLLGTVFDGQYKIEAELASGSLGIIYRARHVLLDRVVTVKVLHSWLCSDDRAMARMKQEANTLTSLQHKNIVGVHDFAVTGARQAYLVMDDWDGVTLANKLSAGGPLPWTDAMPVFSQICDALGHANQHGVIHRDLCPSNIILTKDKAGELLVKIVDFGLAKIVSVEESLAQRLTPTGDLIGNPTYMSPEQCQGKELSVTADIYSLGCVMYETLCGRPPFAGTTPAELVSRHLHEAPVSLRSVFPNADIPEKLDALVLKAIEKESGRRFQSTSEISQELQSMSAQFFASAAAGGKLSSGTEVRAKSVPALPVSPLIALLLSTLFVLLALLYFCFTDEGRIQSLRAEITIIQSLGSADDARLIEPIGKLASIYREHGMWSEARERYESLIPIVQKSTAPDSPQSIMLRLDRADMLKQLGDRTAYVNEVNKTGELFCRSRPLNQSEYQTEVELLLRLLPMLKDTGDLDELSCVLRRLASCYQSQGNYADAIDCIHRCLEVLSKCKEEGMSDGVTVMTQITLADYYSDIGELVQAEDTLKVGLDYAKQNEYKVYMNRSCNVPDEIYCKLVEVCKKENKISQAQSYAGQYLEYCQDKYGKGSFNAEFAAKLVSSVTPAGADSPVKNGIDGKKK